MQLAILLWSFALSADAIRLREDLESVYFLEMAMKQADFAAKMSTRVVVRQTEARNVVVVRLLDFSDPNDEYFQLDETQKTELGSPFLITQRSSGRHSFNFGRDESVAVVDIKFIVASKLVLTSELREKTKKGEKSVLLDVLELMLRDCRTSVSENTFVTDLHDCKVEESPAKLARDSEYKTSVRVDVDSGELLELRSEAKFVFLGESGRLESSLFEEVSLKFVDFQKISGTIDLQSIDS